MRNSTLSKIIKVGKLAKTLWEEPLLVDLVPYSKPRPTNNNVSVSHAVWVHVWDTDTTAGQ